MGDTDKPMPQPLGDPNTLALKQGIEYLLSQGEIKEVMVDGKLEYLTTEKGLERFRELLKDPTYRQFVWSLAWQLYLDIYNKIDLSSPHAPLFLALQAIRTANFLSEELGSDVYNELKDVLLAQFHESRGS